MWGLIRLGLGPWLLPHLLPLWPPHPCPEDLPLFPPLLLDPFGAVWLIPSILQLSFSSYSVLMSDGFGAFFFSHRNPLNSRGFDDLNLLVWCFIRVMVSSKKCWTMKPMKISFAVCSGDVRFFFNQLTACTIILQYQLWIFINIHLQ